MAVVCPAMAGLRDTAGGGGGGGGSRGDGGGAGTGFGGGGGGGTIFDGGDSATTTGGRGRISLRWSVAATRIVAIMPLAPAAVAVAEETGRAIFEPLRWRRMEAMAPTAAVAVAPALALTSIAGGGVLATAVLAAAGVAQDVRSSRKRHSWRKWRIWWRRRLRLRHRD